VNYHLKPIKSLVKSIIKKIKLKIGKDALEYNFNGSGIA